MNREVYKHLLSTYGRKPGLWFGLTTEIFRTLLTRVFTVALLASLAGSIAAGDTNKAKHYVWIYLIITVVAAVVGSIGEIVALHTENNVYQKLMLEYYKKLTNKDMSFYRDSHTGYLTTMFRQYLDSAMQLVRMFRGDIIKSFITFTAPVVVLYYYSWQIGTIALLVVISQATYMVWASSQAHKYRDMSHEIYRKISGEVNDDITNIVAYKAAGKEDIALERISELAKQETATFTLRRRTAVFLELPRNIITILLVSIAFMLVINTSTTTSSTVTLLVLTLTYIFQILRNVADLPELIASHDDWVLKLAPTMEALEAKHEKIKDIADPKLFEPTTASIEFRDVSFKYKDHAKSKAIFKNLNLTIEGGQHIGIVGLSGAGKSTLASLLMRFDDVNSGTILIDGTDIREVNQSVLRQNIAYVPQEPVLFHRTIKENIAYHNSSATDKQIHDAAKAAYADAFIDELPDSYNTTVGERGVKLSGGQKQRIVIARAILKNAPIVLFDEATSALDSESENIIQKALPKILGNHTAVIIAHRLSTVANLDRIVVMHNGSIEEEGTHTELLRRKGRYYSLWQKQTTQESPE